MKGNYYRKATNRAKWFVGTKHQYEKHFRKVKIFQRNFQKVVDKFSKVWYTIYIVKNERA